MSGYGYGSHLCFDELNATGHKVRMKNKMKAKNMMLLAVNFADATTLQKIQAYLKNLSPEEMGEFKTFLKKRAYLGKSADFAKSSKVLDKITRIALTSMPQDSRLRQIATRYTENLEMIDQLKVQTTKTTDMQQLRQLIGKIDELNQMNVLLIQQIHANKQDTKETTPHE